jgi:SAM-dependent methyltransferase
MDTNIWGQQVAERYDATSAFMYTPDVLEPTADFLARRAGRGRALEFAVGTGRVALALSARGVPVVGIDSSEPMLAQLRGKPGAGDVPVVLGDMAHARVPGTFSLVYLVYNTITNLLTQAEQVECFRNAASHLEPGGRFVIEVFVPELRRLPPGETARPFHIGEHHLGFDTFDVVNQRLVSHHYRIDDGGVTDVFRSPHRYVWPAELDLMATIADLELRARWADWNENAFTAESTAHVSVWQKRA